MTMAVAAEPRSYERPRTGRPTIANAVLITLIVVAAVVAAFPLAWMVLTSLKTPQETMQVPPAWLPAGRRA